MEEEGNHFYNALKLLERIPGKTANDLRAYYTARFRGLEKHVELPKKTFGPTAMCKHCGASWALNEHKVRILSGKTPSQKVKKLLLNSNEYKSKCRKSLIHKCQLNEPNKLSISCPLCKKNTILPIDKPKRLRPEPTQAQKLLIKKKKRRSKDKFAGLNISGCLTLPSKPLEQKSNTSNSSASVAKLKTTFTPKPKVKKINFNRLKDILANDSSTPKKSSLHSFLQGL